MVASLAIQSYDLRWIFQNHLQNSHGITIAEHLGMAVNDIVKKLKFDAVTNHLEQTKGLTLDIDTSKLGRTQQVTNCC